MCCLLHGGCRRLYECMCRGGVERPRLSPGPAGAVRHGQHLFSARSALVRRGHGARHHARPQSSHRV